MPMKETSHGQVYVPRGSTTDPCPGCGSDELRKRDRVCPTCAMKINQYDIIQSEARDRTMMPTQVAAHRHDLPFLPHVKKYEVLQGSFFDLSMLLSIPTQDQRWVSSVPTLWPHKDNGFDRSAKVTRLMDESVRAKLHETYKNVMAALSEAHATGAGEGKNLLMNLASGRITNDEFNEKAARLEKKE